MKLSRLTTSSPATSGPPPDLMRELHLRRARLHVQEAIRDLAEHDPTLSGVLDSVVDALDVTIEDVARTWH